MKRFIIGLCMATPLLLLPACGPKEVGGHSASGQSASASATQSGDLSAAPSPENQPVAQCADAWLAEYAPELANLGRSMEQLAAEYDMLYYDCWPDDRQGVRVDTMSLLFSAEPRQPEAVCAALGATLNRDTSVDVLRSEWEDTLIFLPDDPVAGACWLARAGEITFRFLTDSQGRSLRTGGANLVLSQDDLLPQQIYPRWADPMLPWIDQLVGSPDPVWEVLVAAAGALGQSVTPQGATQEVDLAVAAALYTGYGVKNPDTGIAYFAFERGQPWEAVTVPAALIFTDGLPTDMDGVIARLSTPFSWGLYGGPGYWFYLGDYKVFLPSDGQGLVDSAAQILVRWGDNAGI